MIFQIILIAIGLAMDAFAVSISCGSTGHRLQREGHIDSLIPKAMLSAAFFGVFQGIMPIIGFYAGKSLIRYISSFDHWVSFIILLIIGGKMIYEAFGNHEEEKKCVNPFVLKTMFVLAIATSLDALAVGITFSSMNQNIISSAIIICIITFILSFIGVFAGQRFSRFAGKWAEVFGGIILIGIGVKILISG